MNLSWRANGTKCRYGLVASARRNGKLLPRLGSMIHVSEEYEMLKSLSVKPRSQTKSSYPLCVNAKSQRLTMIVQKVHNSVETVKFVYRSMMLQEL